MPKDTIQSSLKKLESIAAWFDDQEEVDVEEGLKKVKEGAVLIKSLKERLKEVENEFEEIKKGIE
jgi:exodeoxyribonuclease VII small subunit